MRAVFAQPGFARLFGGLATSMLGDSVMLLVLSMWVKTLTGSNALAGLTFLFMVLPAVLAPLVGVCVDRLPRKAVLVWGNVASALVVLPLVLVRDASHTWIVWAVAFGYGVSFVVLPAALNGLLKELLPDEALVDANASIQTTKEGFRLFGPLVGAALFAAVGGWAVALVDAASFGVAAALIASIEVREEPVKRDTRGLWPQLTAGARYIATERILRHVLIGFGLTILVIGFFEASIYALLDAFDREPTYAGFLVTVQGVGAVMGGVLSARLVRGLGEVGSLVLGLALIAVATAVAASAPTMLVVLGALAVMGFGLPCTFVPFTTLVQRRSPRRLMGRVSAAVEILMATPQAVSLAVGSVLVSVLDYRAIFWVIAATVALGAGYIAAALRGELGREVVRVMEPEPVRGTQPARP
ncbi:MFS transporter [Nocardioides acrostichi]|uniref:MFS transporter n=1 Tax=Nocardioides acrostichi TaxID=2784339 RepID=A0A930Y8W8_9ACTN|nr:MFS transporter [Nocardioides acrostichi]MBF4163506.1 MFS transporter [Nocardioides acrostichi]